MLIGAHVSVAGGLPNGPKNAHALGLECFQFFSRSPQGGPAPEITPAIQDAFLNQCQTLNLKRWVIHTPYYINFANPESRIRKNSERIVREELERATLLSATHVMFHPGSGKEVGQERGLAMVVEGIKRVLDGYTGSAKLLIEISAGAGSVIGASFEEVAEILAGVDHPELGVCFDTAHAFASGYDLRTPDAVQATFAQFDRLIGLDRLKMSHCNDSKIPLGGRKDRHDHLGDGHIGVDGFRAIVNHPRLKQLDLFLETEPTDQAKDIALLYALRAERV